jgi:hypothetical protein
MVVEKSNSQKFHQSKQRRVVGTVQAFPFSKSGMKNGVERRGVKRQNAERLRDYVAVDNVGRYVQRITPRKRIAKSEKNGMIYTNVPVCGPLRADKFADPAVSSAWWQK